MVDECTDVTTIEKLTICCCWVESGVPEEHFIEIFPLKKGNNESIYSALVEYCWKKKIQLGRLIGMGFDGAFLWWQNRSSRKVERALTSCIVWVNKGDSEKTRSSRAHDCETVRHTLTHTWALCQSSKTSYSSIVMLLKIYMKHHMNQKLLDQVKPFLVTPQ